MTDGMLLVKKPVGVTSHDVVDVIRRKLGVRRVGHTGTLDPCAEGLLILLVGRATKRQQALQRCDKVYEAVIRLGTQTETGDSEGRAIRHAPVPALDPPRVREVLASFEGRSAQTPPAYSAVKVRGRPAYWWARRQQRVALAPRIVELSEMTLVVCGPETLTFRVRCSTGTYIRSLAESITERLGTVGHLAQLNRLRIGRWSVEEAQPLDRLQDASSDEVARQLRSCDD